ncbi:protein-disulfide reductase DsbD [Aureimonas glaciei]|uniref:Thiol:disulfide interchange protein DsbD 2 n=1 Tax=Aureimonas glaciei TaxID=1776957 RepID=A0A916XWQ9_9HYPH|nr:protein-disulfide reductase DsbD [Aureimonas glaciei]GGD17689.1 thiol:disulfide interchange protein DsbD 2 [Aureimonas glaciei]
MPFARFLPLAAAGLLAALTLSAPSRAQTAPLPVERAFALSVSAAEDGGRQLTFAIADGYYLYRDKISAATPTGAALPLDLPEGERKDDPTFGPMQVFHHAVTAPLPALAGGESQIAVSYQGCQEGGICYRPVTTTVDLASTSPARGLLSRAAGPKDLWSRPPSAPMSVASTTPGASDRQDPSQPQALVSNLPAAPAGAEGAAEPASGIRVDAAAGGLVTTLLADGGALWVIATFFALGLGLAFTPCVFPMYPILAGQLSRTGERLSTGRGFALSAVYVLAMAAAFGLLGVFAAWSGQNLQLALQSRTAILIVSAVFVVLALSMFGAFELRLPAAFTNAMTRRTAGARGSLASSATLGFTSALIVGPCVTAPLAGGLIYIAQSGSVVLGASALFALGLGQGIPLIVFGTVGARAMPKPGRWMAVVTRLFGFAFLGLAVWMLSRILPPALILGLWSALLIGAGVFLGAFDHLTSASGPLPRAAKASGLLAILYGAILAVGASAGAGDPLRPLALLSPGSAPVAAADIGFRTVQDPAELASTIAAARRPTLLYFTADWCVTCDVIERAVFGDSSVQARLGGFQRLKVDLTEDQAGGRAMMRDLGVVGPPTMLFVDAAAKEVPGSRLVGDITADSFLAAARLGHGGTR